MATWKPDDMIAIPIAGEAPRAPLRPERDYARVSVIALGGLAPTAQPFARARAGTAQGGSAITVGTPSRVADLPVRAGKVRLDIRVDSAPGADAAPPWLAGSLDLSSIAEAPEYIAVLRELPNAPLSIKGGALLIDDLPAPDDLDYALIHIERLRDPDFDDDLRKTIEDAVRTFQTGTARTRDAAYAFAARAIATHPLLVNADRRRFVELLTTERDQPRVFGATPPAIGFEQLAQQLSPNRDPSALDVAALLDVGDPAQPATAQTEIHWSTRVLDGDTPVADLVVAVAHDYDLETGLTPTALDDAAAAVALPAGLIADGTDVRFVVRATTPVLRAKDRPDDPRATQVAGVRTFKDGQCPPLRVVVRPDQPGVLRLDVALYTANAMRFSMPLALHVAAPATEPPPPAIPVTASALTGPCADLRIEITRANQLEVAIGQTQDQPRPLPSTNERLRQEGRIIHNQLVELSRAYLPDPARGPFGMVGGREAMLAIARLGAKLHELLLDEAEVGDPSLQALARAIATTAGPARLQVCSGTQWFPWAIVYDGRYRNHPLTDEDSVDTPSFWGARFRIDRMIYGMPGAGREPVLPARVRVQPCLNATLDTQQAAAGVAVVANQRGLFTDAALATAPWIESRADFVRYVQQAPPCDLLYLFCHARAAASLDAYLTFSDQLVDVMARLELAPDQAIDIDTLRTLRTAPLPDRPLVFLNACSTAAGDAAFQSPFLEQFLRRWKAAGVIGTDWEVPTMFADAFARHVLDGFLHQRLPLATAIANTTAAALAADNPFALIYALYAPPQLVVQPGAPS